MNIDRYDIEAGRNILTMLQRTSPAAYAVLMTKLKTKAGMNGALGLTQSSEENAPGFWTRLFEVGSNALTTIADFRVTQYVKEETTTERQLKQQAYDDAVVAEMERQALLAARAQSQAMEYANQMEFVRQQADLQRAGERAKSKMNWAFIAVGGLLGLWVLTRMIT